MIDFHKDKKNGCIREIIKKACINNTSKYCFE